MKISMRTTFLAGIYAGALLMTSSAFAAPMPSAQEIVSQYTTVFTETPQKTPWKASVQGPLMGNGDMGIAMARGPENQSFLFCKNDLWRLQTGDKLGSPVVFGSLSLSIADLKEGSYHVEQDLYTATTTGTFAKEDLTVTMTSYVAAMENLFVLEVVAEGRAVNVKTSFRPDRKRGSLVETGAEGDVNWGLRAFVEDVDIPSGAAVAWKLIGASEHYGNSFVLKPGEPVLLVAAMDSVFKSEDYKEQVIQRVQQISSKADLATVREAHDQWWAAYWEKSYVDIPDPVVEQHYYLSLYGIGSISRDPAFPPGLFGWVTNSEPTWQGDYHMNYNHVAPFYGLARANRLEQADPHETPIFEFIERAQWHCREIFGFDGVMYPVGIGPMGIETGYDCQRYLDKGETVMENKGMFFGQRSNSAYCLVNMAPRWYTTYDPDYGRKIYPLVEQVVTFWENFLVWQEDKNRYAIIGDAIHEGSGEDVNPILSLGLVRNTFQLALDLSKELNLEPQRRDKWNHVLEHLSEFPLNTERRDKKTIFRYSEEGKHWWANNTLGIQHIYPAGQIHLDSDPELLEISHNMIQAMRRWHDKNGSNSFFPAAVRVGFDPEVILEQLNKYAQNTHPNGFMKKNPHGIENYSTVPNTINEMLCMGHAGVLRVFPVWPKDQDAAFRSIRVWGAFLVSGILKDGTVELVHIVSERGRPCTIQNPWPGQSVQVIRNGKPAERVSGERFTLKTLVNEQLVLKSAN